MPTCPVIAGPVTNIAYAIILRRQNTCDNGIASTCLGDIGELLKYCATLLGRSRIVRLVFRKELTVGIYTV